MGMGMTWKEKIAYRAAKEIKQGMIVNLGIGIPSLISNYVSKEDLVTFHSENGIIGMGEAPQRGEEDPLICHAGGYPVSTVPWTSYTDSTTAFAIIRKGLIDITFLGGLEVNVNGDLANWIIPGKRLPGMGGATELAAKSKNVIVLMSQFDKNGNCKLVKECTIPKTASACVQQIFTERGKFLVKDDHFLFVEAFSKEALEVTLREKVECIRVSHDIFITE
ncbi:acyl CoA:acetate/3-ketoacid CoA transferase subunit beta [Bacillus coahuilensis]|uniref:acyl CoA:acetate/3-ketoacid CoA transferase subunit beta n=1 Tax=Bacillus coahuilensis TaxID=408580 RepID=UPI0001850C2D|nr:acyl CoA:acetate/3-ketoacid CoA transferase subunit beta [Bacillus coahuilensis]